VLATMTVVAIVAPGLGQSGRRPAQQAETKTTQQDGEPGTDVQLGTQEVLLSVSVRDAEQRPVTSLTQDDFIVAEDRVRQKLTSCSVSTVPVNVVLVLDASGSVFSELKSIRAAAETFVDALGPDDKISVVQFAEKVELLQDWTGDHEAVRHAISWRYKAGEATAYWDAVYLAADEQLSKVEGRRAVIILSDGVDTVSKVTEEQTLAALDRSDTSVFVVSKAQALIERIRPYAGAAGAIRGSAPQARTAIATLEASQERMQAMADRYGGRLFAPLDNEDLTQVYKDVATELKQQYVITYVPQNESKDGRWRSIEIYLTRPGLVARTRKGYVAQ
jgi:Ca-activated chloride channel family protein